MLSNDKDNFKNVDKCKYLLFLLLNTNLIFKWGAKIFEFFPSLDAIFSSDINLTNLGVTPEEAMKFRNPNWHSVDECLTWAAQDGHHIITLGDSSYPPLLEEIANPPLILFVMGNLALLRSKQLAMVGSRTPTPQGILMAKNFAKNLGNLGLTITSGLALGIDAASHRGALEGSGYSVAVLGSGFYHIYPASNKSLLEEIVARGGIAISEYPLHAKARSWHFPLRNRIISGLSLGTLVVEAALESGSLITARYAGEQGREVFAIPGSIYNYKARGTNHLISQGAKLLTDLADIIDEFPSLDVKKNGVDFMPLTGDKKNKLDSPYHKLLDCIGFEFITVEEIILKTNLPEFQVREFLLELELQGKVMEVMGSYACIG